MGEKSFQQKKMVQRITYKRRLCWNTSSNQKKIIKTPGGKLAFQYTGKRGSIAKCADTGKKLQGIKAHRPKQLAVGRTQRRAKTVSRAYGGVVSAESSRSELLELFLLKNKNWLPRSPSNLEKLLLRLLRKKLPRLLRSLRNPRVRSK